MSSQMKAEGLPRKLSSFWIGPLVAGSCLASGYEITQRFIILKSTQQPKIKLSNSSSLFNKRELEEFKPHHSSVQDPSFRINARAKSQNFDESKKEKRIQTLLQALETGSSGLEIPKENRPKRFSRRSATQELSITKTQSIFGQSKIDELFKTLSEY